MATPDRDTIYTNRETVYSNDGTDRTVYSRESNATGWFVGIIVALALLAIAYLVFSANSQPSTTTVNNTPEQTNTTTPADTNATPMAPATTTTNTPATTAPANNAATDTTTTPTTSAPATTSSAAQ